MGNKFLNAKNKIFESKPVNSLLSFFNFGNSENNEEEKEPNLNVEKNNIHNYNNNLDNNNIDNSKNNENNSNI